MQYLQETITVSVQPKKFSNRSIAMRVLVEENLTCEKGLGSSTDKWVSATGIVKVRGNIDEFEDC